jgi:hypothetical protein
MKDSAMNMQENVVPIETPRSAVIRSDRLIGAILADEGKLTQTEIDRVLRLQKDIGIRFGEAAVQLGFISNNDVRYALAAVRLPAAGSQRGIEGSPAVEGAGGCVRAVPSGTESCARFAPSFIRWYNP